MTDNAKKTSELATANTIAGSDRFVFLYQANSSAPSTRTITVNNFANSFNLTRLKNANATLTIDNTGIVAVTIGNTVGYIGDVESANGLDIYASGGAGAGWVSMTYSLSGNDAVDSTVTGYAYLGPGGSQNPDSVNFAINIPANSSFGSYWTFYGANSTIEFPDSTHQSTAYSISGPFADDTAAAAGGIALNGLYYDASGNVKIRLI